MISLKKLYGASRVQGGRQYLSNRLMLNLILSFRCQFFPPLPFHPLRIQFFSFSNSLGFWLIVYSSLVSITFFFVFFDFSQTSSIRSTIFHSFLIRGILNPIKPFLGHLMRYLMT